MPKKSYEHLTGQEKVQKQWHKLAGLRSREELSEGIVRAATTAELVTNFAQRVDAALAGPTGESAHV